MEFNFRPVNASDIAPMCVIINKIGIENFSRCFENEELFNLIRTTKSKNDGEGKKNTVTVAGIKVAMDLASVITANLPKCELEIFTLLGSVSQDYDAKQVRELPLGTFVKFLKAFFQNEEFKGFIEVASELFKSE